MWALAQGESIRHDYGCKEPHPIAICGHEGDYPLYYDAVTNPKCQQCLLLWATYGKEKKPCGEQLEK